MSMYNVSLYLSQQLIQSLIIEDTQNVFMDLNFYESFVIITLVYIHTNTQAYKLYKINVRRRTFKFPSCYKLWEFSRCPTDKEIGDSLEIEGKGLCMKGEMSLFQVSLFTATGYLKF